jgi:hypothetical protein
VHDRTVRSVVNAGAGAESQGSIANFNHWEYLRLTDHAAHAVGGQETLLDKLRRSGRGHRQQAEECQ